MKFTPGTPKPAGSGRQKGTPNKSTADLRALAQKYGPQALQCLVNAMETGDTTASRISAATALLDRGFGKPKQMIEASGPDGGPIETTPISDEQCVAAVMTLLAEQRAKLNGG